MRAVTLALCAVVLALIAPPAGAASKDRVLVALRALYDQGALERSDYVARHDDFVTLKADVRRFSGRRRADMDGLLRTIEGIAARGDLTPSRLAPLWLTLQRNTQWWDTGPLPAAGARVTFPGSEIIWQYVPGQGLQLHPLANFGRLDALTVLKRDRGRMTRMLDELVPLAADRAGGVAWEYYFDYGGGHAPWVSGLAQGTALQAIAKAADKLGRGDELLPLAHRGLAIFETAPPEGVREDRDGGLHFLQYSFAPRLWILNGFIQSLVGLHDYATIAQDPDAAQLLEQGLVAARAEVPAYDTGAWSLYARGSSEHESNLSYHVLLRDFLQDLCDRVPDTVWCGAAERFTADLTDPPVLRVVTRRIRFRRSSAIAYEVSKPAQVHLVLRRGSAVVLDRALAAAGGRHALTFTAAHRGPYDVELSAVDLAGNRAEVGAALRSR